MNATRIKIIAMPSGTGKTRLAEESSVFLDADQLINADPVLSAYKIDQRFDPRFIDAFHSHLREKFEELDLKTKVLLVSHPGYLPFDEVSIIGCIVLADPVLYVNEANKRALRAFPGGWTAYHIYKNMLCEITNLLDAHYHYLIFVNKREHISLIVTKMLSTHAQSEEYNFLEIERYAAGLAS